MARIKRKPVPRTYIGRVGPSPKNTGEEWYTRQRILDTQAYLQGKYRRKKK